jgi:hypothetical protein
MKGLCINLVKNHDYPPNYGIVFYKKYIYLKKKNTLNYLILNDDEDFMLASPKGQTPLKIKKFHT